MRQTLPDSLPPRTVVLYNARRPTTKLPGYMVQRRLGGAVDLAGWWRGEKPARATLHALRNRPLLDFKVLRNFSHLSRQVFSHHRWACVGESGVFLDPFYSPGSDLISIHNTLIVHAIQQQEPSAACRVAEQIMRAAYQATVTTSLARMAGSPSRQPPATPG